MKDNDIDCCLNYQIKLWIYQSIQNAIAREKIPTSHTSMIYLFEMLTEDDCPMHKCRKCGYDIFKVRL